MLNTIYCCINCYCLFDLQNFQANKVSINKLDGEQLLKNLNTKLEAMFNRKRKLAFNIAKKAEELADKHVYDSNLKFDFPSIKHLYDSELELSNLTLPAKKPSFFEAPKDEEDYRRLYEDPRYFPVKVEPDPGLNNVAINAKLSAVHVPTNVYYGLNNTKNSIKWSAGLDKTFIANRDNDPQSSYQFFCSNDGFMRIYPLHFWRYPDFFVKTAAQPASSNLPLKPLDFYDCRMTQWFTKAASSPKDMAILVDASGSMKGYLIIFHLLLLLPYSCDKMFRPINVV